MYIRSGVNMNAISKPDVIQVSALARTRSATLFLLLLALCLTGSSVSALNSMSANLRPPLVLALLFITYAEAIDESSFVGRIQARFKFGLVALLGLALVSSIWSITPMNSLIQGAFWAAMTAIVLGSQRRAWKTMEGIRRDLAALISAITICGAASLLFPQSTDGRFSGILANPNTLGALSAIGIALGMGSVRDRGWRPRYLVAIAVMTPNLLMSESRTALGAIAIAALWIILSARLSLRSLAVSLFGAAAAIFYFAAGGRVATPEVLARFSGEGDRFSGRGEGWDLALTVWHEHPFFGVGFRAGATAFERQNSSFGLEAAHNSWLQVLLELGLTGFLVFLFISATVAVALLSSRHAPALAASGGVVLVGFCTGLTESALIGAGQAISWSFWLSAGILVSGSRTREA